MSWSERCISCDRLLFGRQAAIEAAPVASLFIKRAAIAEIADAFAPGAVAAGLEGVSHQSFHLFLSQAVFAFDIGEADVIGERHFDDLTAVSVGERVEHGVVLVAVETQGGDRDLGLHFAADGKDSQAAKSSGIELRVRLVRGHIREGQAQCFPCARRDEFGSEGLPRTAQRIGAQAEIIRRSVAADCQLETVPSARIANAAIRVHVSGGLHKAAIVVERDIAAQDCRVAALKGFDLKAPCGDAAHDGIGDILPRRGQFKCFGGCCHAWDIGRPRALCKARVASGRDQKRHVVENRGCEDLNRAGFAGGSNL